MCTRAYTCWRRRRAAWRILYSSTAWCVLNVGNICQRAALGALALSTGAEPPALLARLHLVQRLKNTYAGKWQKRASFSILAMYAREKVVKQRRLWVRNELTSRWPLDNGGCLSYVSQIGPNLNVHLELSCVWPMLYIGFRNNSRFIVSSTPGCFQNRRFCFSYQQSEKLMQGVDEAGTSKLLVYHECIGWIKIM